MVKYSLAALQASPVIAVVRKISANHLRGFVDALVSGGITCIEVTLNTPGALGMIAELGKDSRLTVAAGTVMGPEAADSAILAGARMVVSPHLNREIITVARRYGVPAVPGAMTPNEIVAAWEAGADAVKVFPAGTLGPRYIREIKAPLDQVSLMATGGISAENAADFIKAGIDYIGVGGALASNADLERQDWAGIADRARVLVETVRAARERR